MLLLIDNIDSFTHNLARYFVELGEQVLIANNTQLSIDDISRLKPNKIVISPGPCTPDDAGISLATVAEYAGKIPILGVCLGHQAIGQVFGAKVVGAQEIKHGKISQLTHDGGVLFENLPTRFNVTRYHSLVLDELTLPESLRCDAWCNTDCGAREIMAISHVSQPIWGVQFHPESLLTEHGHDLLNNFIQQANQYGA